MAKRRIVVLSDGTGNSSAAVWRTNVWRTFEALDSRKYDTVRDLAKAEAINESYLGRILRLTLLSPSLIEAILEGRQPGTIELDDLLKQFPIEWDQQFGMQSQDVIRASHQQ